MAKERQVLNVKVLIEYSHQNGYVRLIKEKSSVITAYGTSLKTLTNYKVQYSATGVKWTTCADYTLRAKNIQYKHFHNACKALQEGIKLTSTKLLCQQLSV